MMKFYRIHDYVIGDNQVNAEFHVWYLVKETPKGYWISAYPQDRDWGWASRDNKWVSKTSVKRHAYPTKEEALNNWRYRKARQLIHCEWNLRKAKALVELSQRADPLISSVRSPYE